MAGCPVALFTSFRKQQNHKVFSDTTGFYSSGRRNISHMSCAAWEGQAGALWPAAPRGRALMGGTPQPVKYLFPGLWGGNRSKLLVLAKTIWAQRMDRHAGHKEMQRMKWLQPAGLRTRAWALAGCGRQRLILPLWIGVGVYLFPLGI